MGRMENIDTIVCKGAPKGNSLPWFMVVCFAQTCL
jgi:hypothetical protein